MAQQLYPQVPVSASYRRPTIIGGSFVLDGATDPSQVSGDVESVRRLLVSTQPFFRVRFKGPVPRVSGTRALSGALSLTVHSGAAASTGSAHEGDLTDDGGDVRDDTREIDLTVQVGADDQADTAGARVDIVWLLDQDPRL